MEILPNIEMINVPTNPSREWVWYRILITIDYSLLKKPTALQWALLKILFNMDKFDELSTEKVAKKLAVESSIIDEGITNLIEEDLISLQPRKKSDILQNYSINEKLSQIFEKHELIPYSKDTRKILLFYDYKDERTYSYQIVEKSEEEGEIEEDYTKILELILLAIIDSIWNNLENNPHILVGEVELVEVLEHKFIKDLQSMIVEHIYVNFL